MSHKTRMIDKITSVENFDEAYKQTQKGKNKYKHAALTFAMNETENINALRKSVIDRSYEFGKYISFMVFEPKERLIHAPGYKDKIVQIAVNNVLKKLYYPAFVYDSYACIDNKGTHKCAERLHHFLRKAKWEYGEEAYIIKLDIKKFFYSIDRGVLKKILEKKVRCRQTYDLLCHIIDSSDQISDVGLPLGNTLSQIEANIYMNEVDKYAKRKLSLKYYIRYADDIVIIVKDKETAKDTLGKMEYFIENNNRLCANKKKTKIFPINQGVNAIGFKMHPTHKLLRNDSKKKMKRKAKKIRRLLILEKMKPEKAEQIFNSWMGHAKNANSHNFINRLISSNDYVYFEDQKFKVDRNLLQKERECIDGYLQKREVGDSPQESDNNKPGN